MNFELEIAQEAMAIVVGADRRDAPSQVRKANYCNATNTPRRGNCPPAQGNALGNKDVKGPAPCKGNCKNATH